MPVGVTQCNNIPGCGFHAAAECLQSENVLYVEIIGQTKNTLVMELFAPDLLADVMNYIVNAFFVLLNSITQSIGD